MLAPSVPLAVVFGLPTVSGCADMSRSCTDVGCFSGGNVDVSAWVDNSPAGSTVEVCANDECESHPLLRSRRDAPDEPVRAGVNLADNEDVAIRRVTVRVTGPDGAEIAADRMDDPPTTKFHPNGPDCGPTCRNASLVLRADGSLAPAPKPRR